jgi:hypothetical protein
MLVEPPLKFASRPETRQSISVAFDGLPADVITISASLGRVWIWICGVGDEESLAMFYLKHSCL